MSALHPKADIRRHLFNVRFVPIADTGNIGRYDKKLLDSTLPGVPRREPHHAATASSRPRRRGRGDCVGEISRVVCHGDEIGVEPPVGRQIGGDDWTAHGQIFECLQREAGAVERGTAYGVSPTSLIARYDGKPARH